MRRKENNEKRKEKEEERRCRYMTKTMQASVSKYCTLDNGLYTTECIEFVNKQRTLMSP